MSFQVCTIITRSYLPQARVLYHSFREFHPDTSFSALLFDASARELNEPFHLFGLGDIGLPAGEDVKMPMLYNVTELATALKPWFFRHLLARDQTPLLYFDPDIEIFSPVEGLAHLANKHSLVLTPHTTAPMSRDDVRPNETDILRAGAYNLGFLGLNPTCSDFLSWWSERLLREAVIDFPNMRFTDQRWMDFAPGYFDTCVAKDETCNVAYWNADSRPLTWSGTRYEIKGQPLCFFHFSGFRPENPHLLSFHQGENPRTRLSEHPAVARLCREYAEKLYAADYAAMHKLAYRFDTAPNGLKITPIMRQAYGIALHKHEKTGSPAPPNAFSEPEAFIAWLNEPLYPARCPELSRYFWAIHASRPELQAAFPDLLGADRSAYYDWLRHHGRRELRIPDELMPPPRVNTSALSLNQTSVVTEGVNLVGYLRAELGLGESGRLMASALASSGQKLCTRVWSGTSSRQEHPWDADSDVFHPPYDTNLICINADQLPRFAHEVGPEFFRARYNVGLWFWEAELFPPPMREAFKFVNEIWVMSEFVREAIAETSPLPVFTIPQPLNVAEPPVAAPTREAFDLPDGFLFLFSFDFFSVLERKNPIGVIKAFQKAFAPGEGPILLIKSINGHRKRAELERLYYARDGRSDIIIRDGYMSAAERDALVATCDCYVSLHRSEGFGLTMAEAMLLEKPVIATRYSGNLEFMDDANSFLCGYRLCQVGAGADPYPSNARWADPDIAEAARLMRLVFDNPEKARLRGQQARRDLCARHDPKIVGELIKNRLCQMRQNKPRPVVFEAAPVERPIVTKVRSTIERGIDVRSTVPSLLTWLLKGPRRAMKQFLRTYEQHQRSLGLSMLDALKEVDSEELMERDSLRHRVSKQEDDLHRLKQELKQTRERLSAMEDGLQPESDRDPSLTPLDQYRSTSRTKNGSA